MGNILPIFSSCFPCMNKSSEPNTTTISIHSTSACCRGKLIQVTINKDDKQVFDEIIKDFIDKIDKKNQVTMV